MGQSDMLVLHGGGAFMIWVGHEVHVSYSIKVRPLKSGGSEIVAVARCERTFKEFEITRTLTFDSMGDNDNLVCEGCRDYLIWLDPRWREYIKGA